MPDPEIELRLKEITDLISLPEIYLKIRRLMADPDSNIDDFAAVISVDPNLCSRVLRLVNSAYFGFPEPVESIPRALNMIGIGQLHNMVLGVSAISSLELPNDFLSLKTFWRASLFAGVLARLLGDKLELAGSENLFVAGLLHEIGHLVLYSKFPLQALAARQLAEEQGQRIHEAELEILGCHYGDIGALLMANWNLSENLQSLTRNHPDPAAIDEHRLEAALVNVAHACGQARASSDTVGIGEPGDSAVQEMIGLTPGEIEATLLEAGSISAEMERVILA